MDALIQHICANIAKGHDVQRDEAPLAVEGALGSRPAVRKARRALKLVEVPDPEIARISR